MPLNHSGILKRLYETHINKNICPPPLFHTHKFNIIFNKNSKGIYQVSNFEYTKPEVYVVMKNSFSMLIIFLSLVYVFIFIVLMLNLSFIYVTLLFIF